MITSRSCSWCHTSNPSTVEQCANCGHDAHMPRMDCRCGRCDPYSSADREAAAGEPEAMLRAADFLRTWEREKEMGL